MQKAPRFILLLSLFLALTALFLSGILLCKHSGVCVSSFGCEINGVDGCAELGRSEYSRIRLPFTQKGLPIAYFGFFYYSLISCFLLGLYLRAKKGKGAAPVPGLFFGILIFGFVFDLFLAYRNFFTLLTPCLLCVYTYLCQLGILFSVSWLYFSPSTSSSKNRGSIRGTLWEELKASRLSWAGAFLSTLIFSLVLYLPGSGGSSGEMPGGSVLPISRVPGVLRELRSLKKRELSAQNLSSYIGGEGAYISIHEWLDFRCPHCRQGSELLKKLMGRWPGRIKLYVRYFPLDGSCNSYIKRKQANAESCKAAWASFCASKKKYYGQFVDGLFRFQSSHTHIDYDSLQTLTEELGGNWSEIRSCMSSRAARAAIVNDIEAAKKIEISATPTIILEGHQLPAGLPEKSWIIRTIDALVLEREGESALQEK